MTKRLEYSKAHHLSTLHDELNAAGIAPTYLGDKPGTAWGIEMDVADDQDETAVAAVVNAHDRAAAQAAWDAARQAEASDNDGIRTAVAVLLADAARLEDTTVAMTLQVVRNHLARTDRMLAGALRVLARRLG